MLWALLIKQRNEQWVQKPLAFVYKVLALLECDVPEDSGCISFASSEFISEFSPKQWVV